MRTIGTLDNEQAAARFGDFLSVQGIDHQVENEDDGVLKRLRWHDVHDGIARVSDKEPETTPLQRGLLRFLQSLPIEKHL
jgi:hypothetical protein